MFSRNIYVSRRQKLIKSVKEGLLLFLGNGEAPLNYSDNQYTFRQDSTWLYYFGIDKPDMAAIIDVESGEEKIFGDDVDIDDIIWMGPQPSVASQAEEVGVSRTAPLADLDRVVKAALGKRMPGIDVARLSFSASCCKAVSMPYISPFTRLLPKAK